MAVGVSLLFDTVTFLRTNWSPLHIPMYAANELAIGYLLAVVGVLLLSAPSLIRMLDRYAPYAPMDKDALLAPQLVEDRLQGQLPLSAKSLFAKKTLSWLVVALGLLVGFLGLSISGCEWLPSRATDPYWYKPLIGIAGVLFLGLTLVTASLAATRDRRRAGLILLIGTPTIAFCLSYPDTGFLAWEKRGGIFYSPFLWIAFGLSLLFAQTQQLLGCWVTANTFELLSIKPLRGRQITLQDGNPDSPPVFAMSDTVWANLFDRDPKILGASLNLNGLPRTVVAIMPPRFRFGGCEVWIPTELNRSSFISGFGVQPNELLAIGRLKRNVSLQAASADLGVMAKLSEKDYPAWFRANYRIVVNSLRDESVGHFKATLLAMVAAVFILLLIGCSNVANLLLARATVREKEIAIRASLGATRSRLIRQMLVESGLLAVASCIGGCLFAFLGLKGMIAAIPPDTIPPEVAISLRSATLELAVGVSVLTTFVCGLAPALHLVRHDLRVGLAGSAKGTSGGFQHGKLRSILVVAEVGLSIVLLTATGLMVRTLRALERVDIGFNPANVAYARLSLPEGRYDTADAKRAYFEKVLDRVAAIPGVIASTEATSFPPYSFGWTEIVVPGKPHSEPWGTTFDMCSEGFFQTLGRHLLRGRLLSRSDVELARHVTVINQTFGRNYFGDEDPIGQRIKFTTFEQWATDWPRDAYFEIIGVIADAKNTGLQDAPRPEVYFPHTVTGTGPRGIMVRTAGNANLVLASLSRAISAADSDVAISELGPMENILKSSYYAGPQFTLIILGTFAIT